MKLFLPDPYWRADLASGALFLYFHDEGIGFTLHASVSTFMTGTDPFDFFRLVEERQPRWRNEFFDFVKYWTAFRTNLGETNKLLEPLRENAFKSAWLVYPRDSDAWESATDLLSSSNLPPNAIKQVIDPFSAADELFSHIFFSKYLEIYHPSHSLEPFETAKAAAASPVPVAHVDWAPLYTYCDELFGSHNLDHLLTTAYMFRMPLLEGVPAVLLSNPRLIGFLASLPIELNRPST